MTLIDYIDRCIAAVHECTHRGFHEIQRRRDFENMYLRTTLVYIGLALTTATVTEIYAAFGQGPGSLRRCCGTAHAGWKTKHRAYIQPIVSHVCGFQVNELPTHTREYTEAPKPQSNQIILDTVAGKLTWPDGRVERAPSMVQIAQRFAWKGQGRYLKLEQKARQCA